MIVNRFFKLFDWRDTLFALGSIVSFIGLFLFDPRLAIAEAGLLCVFVSLWRI